MAEMGDKDKKAGQDALTSNKGATDIFLQLPVGDFGEVEECIRGLNSSLDGIRSKIASSLAVSPDLICCGGTVSSDAEAAKNNGGFIGKVKRMIKKS